MNNEELINRLENELDAPDLTPYRRMLIEDELIRLKSEQIRNKNK